MKEPTLISGALFTDDRGSVGFVNDFAFAGVKRFYSIRNHHAGFVRAWHGHKHEEKFFTVVCGAAKIGAVAIDDWNSPSKTAHVREFVLAGTQPAVLQIPAESRDDDFRFPARHWDIWKVAER